MIEIKRGSENEINVAHQLMQEAFKEYENLEVPSSAITEPVDVLRDSYRNGSEQFLVCYVNGVPHGSARFSLKEEALYFSRVSVPPYARRKGIAKAMIDWLEDYARNAGKPNLECKVRLALTSNVRLYESLGFVITKDITAPNPNGATVQAVVMEKCLGLSEDQFIHSE